MGETYAAPGASKRKSLYDRVRNQASAVAGGNIKAKDEVKVEFEIALAQ